MKIDLLALYQRSLLGGIGGLVGWALITMFVPVESGSLVRTAGTGALIGLALGGACGLWEGLFRDRSPQRAIRGLGLGAGIGLVGGLAGLTVGEAIFWIAGGGLLPRAVGWGIFGACVGTTEGLSRKMPQRQFFGAYGGLLGGLIGGSTYQFLASASARWLGFARDLGLAVGGAVGLVLLGMFIGCLIGLVEDLLRAAWLVFTSGQLEGQTRTLDPSKAATTIGRSELADVCVRGEESVAQQHARVVSEQGQFVLEAVDGEVLAGPAGQLKPVGRHPLTPEDYIQVGTLRARFETGNGRP